MSELDFPVESFLHLKQELVSYRKEFERDKAIWLATRKSLDKAALNVLDEQFKATFEELGASLLSSSSSGLHAFLQSLEGLVQKGAAATLLGNYELGSYNLAMFVQHICRIDSKASLDMACKIIRLTIVAGADLNAQKAYAGNGGSTALEWICIYLAGGINDNSYMRSLDQFASCYKIFLWIIESGHLPERNDNVLHPFTLFIAGLHTSAEVADLQEKVILAMIAHGISPIAANELYQSSFFSRLAAINVNWLSLLFPFQHDHLKRYLEDLQLSLTPALIKQLINGFTSSNKARKHFKVFFSQRAHWLLKFIIESVPAMIFDLVKRNEKDLLVPFIKNYPSSMKGLRDEKGNTLLHQAVLSRGVSESTIQLLRNANFSVEVVNAEGVTVLELAEKSGRGRVVTLLK